MRLIDADALAEKMEKEIYRYWNEDGGGYYLAEDAIEEVKYAPTVEAEPVWHGKWIEHKYAEEHGGQMISNWECSECHQWFRTTRNYCGECGAKMEAK